MNIFNLFKRTDPVKARLESISLVKMAPCGCPYPREVSFPIYDGGGTIEDYGWRKFDPVNDAENFESTHERNHPDTR